MHTGQVVQHGRTCGHVDIVGCWLHFFLLILELAQSLATALNCDSVSRFSLSSDS